MRPSGPRRTRPRPVDAEVPAAQFSGDEEHCRVAHTLPVDSQKRNAARHEETSHCLNFADLTLELPEPSEDLAGSSGVSRPIRFCGVSASYSNWNKTLNAKTLAPQ